MKALSYISYPLFDVPLGSGKVLTVKVWHLLVLLVVIVPLVVWYLKKRAYKEMMRKRTAKARRTRQRNLRKGRRKRR